MDIVLASASPRRQELLRQIGCKFTVMPSEIDEKNDGQMSPNELAVANARIKAMDVAGRTAPSQVVVGADTIVVLDGRVFGKPADADDARRMLEVLSGRWHEVVTGIAVVKGDNLWTDCAVTKVKMAELNAEDIDRYIVTGEPMDKAGAYAIQGIGALFIEEIVGCYNNVVGLPLYRLTAVLKKAGVQIL